MHIYTGSLQILKKIKIVDMETIASSPNYELSFDSEAGIIMMKFIGDMTDEVYKHFWTTAIDFGVKHQVNRIIIDQQSIGNVSFTARGWVVVSAFPRVKKEMPKNMAAAVLSSGRVVQKTGMQYLMKAFVALTSYKVEVYPTIEEATAYLKKANQKSKIFV